MSVLSRDIKLQMAPAIRWHVAREVHLLGQARELLIPLIDTPSSSCRGEGTYRIGRAGAIVDVSVASTGWEHEQFA